MSDLKTASRSVSHPQVLTARALAALERFTRIEAVSGIVLLLAALVALIWANSPAAEAYEHLWHTQVTFGLGDFSVSQSLHFLVNDGLMTIFFLVVGVEIRQEIKDGALASLKLATLPLGAALGGVMMPAIIYLLLNHGTLASTGWAVPTATDIAFAVGVLALLGKAIPSGIRVLLLALAIIDDIVAILIIAAFYTVSLDYLGLVIAAGGVLLVLLFQRMGISRAYMYILPGAVVWFGLLKTGVHPTLAGVILGLLTPVTAQGDTPAPVKRVQAGLHHWVAYGIMPLFALANAGVNLQGVNLSDGLSLHVALGVTLALVLGKPLGVLLACLTLVKLNVCKLPDGVTWAGVGLVGLLAGIGFTMSIFIAGLAFNDPALLSAAKLSVLGASSIAAVLGLIWGKVRFAN